MNNTAIPNDKNEASVETSGTSIVSTLRNALAGGRIGDVLGFFKNGGSQSDPIVQEATSNYAQDLKQTVGLDDVAAQDAAAKLVPQTMTQLASRTADPSDNTFNIQEIFNSLSGGKTGGVNIQSLLNRFGDKDGDGDVDLQDLKSMFTGGGGLLDNVKGLFR